MKLMLVFGFVVMSILAMAQDEVEMADAIRSSGKIYVILAIVLIVLFGMIAYLFMLDRKISRLERETGKKPKQQD